MSEIFEHKKHHHEPRNVNEAHAREQHSVNARVALMLNRHVGTMLCAYIFAGIGVGSLIGVLTGNVFLTLFFGSVSSYFLQLVLLPVIMVAQNVLNRKQELLAEEQYKTIQKTYHDTEQMRLHMHAQDAKILEILEKLERLEEFR